MNESPSQIPSAAAVALVSGASRGIGAAVARELARRGFTVAINYRQDEAAAAATSAPSASNRQPWRFAVVTSPRTRADIAHAVRTRAEEMKAIIRRGHHADDFGAYGDFFHEPLLSAAAIIIPQYREYPDLIANLLASGGADPGQFHTAAAMQAELCSTSAAVMALLLQAHASGLGACWMAGPTIARDTICRLLDVQAPWRMVGAIALGYAAGSPPPPQPRKSIERIVQWFED